MTSFLGIIEPENKSLAECFDGKRSKVVMLDVKVSDMCKQLPSTDVHSPVDTFFFLNPPEEKSLKKTNLPQKNRERHFVLDSYTELSRHSFRTLIRSIMISIHFSLSMYVSGSPKTEVSKAIARSLSAYMPLTTIQTA